MVGKWLPALHPPLTVSLSRGHPPDLEAALGLRHFGIGLLGVVPRGRPGPKWSPSLLDANTRHPEVYKIFVKLL